MEAGSLETSPISGATVPDSAVTSDDHVSNVTCAASNHCQQPCATANQCQQAQPGIHDLYRNVEPDVTFNVEPDVTCLLQHGVASKQRTELPRSKEQVSKQRLRSAELQYHVSKQRSAEQHASKQMDRACNLVSGLGAGCDTTRILTRPDTPAVTVNTVVEGFGKARSPRREERLGKNTVVYNSGAKRSTGKCHAPFSATGHDLTRLPRSDWAPSSSSSCASSRVPSRAESRVSNHYDYLTEDSNCHQGPGEVTELQHSHKAGVRSEARCSLPMTKDCAVYGRTGQFASNDGEITSSTTAKSKLDFEKVAVPFCAEPFERMVSKDRTGLMQENGIGVKGQLQAVTNPISRSESGYLLNATIGVSDSEKITSTEDGIRPDSEICCIDSILIVPVESDGEARFAGQSPKSKTVDPSLICGQSLSPKSNLKSRFCRPHGGSDSLSESLSTGFPSPTYSVVGSSVVGSSVVGSDYHSERNDAESPIESGIGTSGCSNSELTSMRTYHSPLSFSMGTPPEKAERTKRLSRLLLQPLSQSEGPSAEPLGQSELEAPTTVTAAHQCDPLPHPYTAVRSDPLPHAYVFSDGGQVEHAKVGLKFQTEHVEYEAFSGKSLLIFEPAAYEGMESPRSSSQALGLNSSQALSVGLGLNVEGAALASNVEGAALASNFEGLEYFKSDSLPDSLSASLSLTASQVPDRSRLPSNETVNNPGHAYIWAS